MKQNLFKRTARLKVEQKQIIYAFVFFAVALGTILAAFFSGMYNLSYFHPNSSNVTSDAHNLSTIGMFTFNFISYFTVQSALIVMFYFGFFTIYHGIKVKSKLFNDGVMIAVGTYLAVTLIIFFTALLPFGIKGFLKDPYSFANTFFQHLILPTSMIVFVIWRLGLKKISWKKYPINSAIICIYPIIYLFYSLLKGQWFYSYTWVADTADASKGQWVYQRWYPYWFINIHGTHGGVSGKIWLVAFVFIILVLIYLIAAGFVFINNFKFNRKERFASANTQTA